jgi:hypothetical protein
MSRLLPLTFGGRNRFGGTVMGDLVKPSTPGEILQKVNSRYAPGEALQEMVQIQKEFQVFSPNVSLQQACRVLGLGPSDNAERAIYYKYLDRLKRVPSDITGVNGHDRIVRARQENLESGSPLPMYNKTHRADEDKRITVTRGKPIPHEDQEYLVISIPVVPSKAVGTSRGRSAGPKRAAPRKTST